MMFRALFFSPQRLSPRRHGVTEKTNGKKQLDTKDTEVLFETVALLWQFIALA